MMWQTLRVFVLSHSVPLLAAMLLTGCSATISESAPIIETENWIKLGFTVSSPGATFVVGSNTSITVTGTTAPSVFMTEQRPKSAQIREFKVLWPDGTVQVYPAGLPTAAPYFLPSGQLTIDLQNYSFNITPLRATSGQISIWAEDTWGFFSDRVVVNLQ